MNALNIELSAEYVAARRVLLDALEGLGSQSRAVVLTGAQAVYLRTGPDSLPIAEYTTDGDLAINPVPLTDSPALGELLEAAGFELAELQGAKEPGMWQKTTTVGGVDLTIPVDLMVPTGVAPEGGRRGARLGPHGNRAARKVPGLEAALVDNDVMTINAFEAGDARHETVRVAGIAALLVAKIHKIGDRLEGERSNRLEDKDAADVLRLMRSSDPKATGKTLALLAADEISAEVTAVTVERFQELFGSRAGVGIEMAVRALRVAMPEERVRAICLSYAENLRAAL